MGARRKVDYEVEEEKYKSEIYTMLLALDCKSPQALQLLSDYEERIQMWLGDAGKGPIVTASVAARIMLDKL